MARNKKVEILSNEQEVLHPMTDGDCVIFEDGQTLTQKLSEDDSVKYTPEIVNSSPMFKVGEGNTVDYSDNVLDGAYERATLQGQTYVNYIQESSADEVTLPTPFTEYERTQHKTLTSDEEGTLGINLVGQSYVNALQHDSEEEFVVLGESLEFQEKKVEYTNEGQIKSAMLKGETLVNLNKVTVEDSSYQVFKDGWQTITTREQNYNMWETGDVSLFKTNTQYLVIIEVKQNNISYDFDLLVGHTNCVFSFSETTGKTHYKSGEVGRKVLTLTTKNNFDGVTCVQRFATDNQLSVSNETVTYRTMFIEYQEGMENWDIPFFEGMQSVTVSTKLENKLGTCTVGSIAQYAKNGKTFTTTNIDNRQCIMCSVTQATTNPINLKPNTKYLIHFKISDLVLDGLSSIELVFSSGLMSGGDCLFGEKANTLISANGVYNLVLTTTDLITSSAFVIKGLTTQWENSGSSLRSLTISNIMCIEYQNGMENWDLPYFEDYQVMKPVQVESVNKNIFTTQTVLGTYDTTYTIHDVNSVTITGTDDTTTYKNVKFLINVKPNTVYKISCKHEKLSGETTALYDVYSVPKNGEEKKYLGGTVINSGEYTQLEVRFYVNATEASQNGTIRYYDMQMEEGNTTTEYVPHQSKTTYSWDEVILRKIGNVEDTLDLTTGEWVQRIGEIVLDGSDDEVWGGNNGTTTTTNRFIFSGLTDSGVTNDSYSLKQYLCDKLQTTMWSETSPLGVTVSTTMVFLYNNSIDYSVSALRTWLQSNPITVQYELAKPIVHKVNLSRPNLQVYDDITHVHTKCLDGTLIPNIYLPSSISYPAILEPSKKYNVCINHTEVSADNPLKVNVGGTEITMTDSRMTLTTPATLAHSDVLFTGKGNKIKESMLIKNSSLLTGDLPHFNGIGSVQLGKTIENLCGASGFKAGNSNTTITWYDNYVHTKISKAGSCVFAYELVKLLENGKKYFIYSPQTLGNSACMASFRQVYNNDLTYAKQLTLLPKDGKCIIEIDQQDNPYTHVCVGCHHDLSLNAEFDMYRPIICEYEPGMEDWDWESIGYFTGTKNIGNEFMRIGNKNLFDGINRKYYINVETYLMGLANNDSGGVVDVSNVDNVVVSSTSTQTRFRIGCTNKLPSKNGETVTVYNGVNLDSNLSAKASIDCSNYKYLIINAVDLSIIQAEESSTATSYTAHKYNGLYITKDQPIDLTWEQGRINPSGVGDSYTNAINNAVSYGIRNKGLLNLKPNTTYRISLGNKASFKYHIALFDNWDNALASSSLAGISGDWVSSRDTTFTTTKDVHKIGINVQKRDASSITPSESVHAQVRLEEVTDVVLRSCSDKYKSDKLDLTRGTYTQNVGVVYLDGVNQHSNYITVIGDGYQPTDTTLKTFDIRCDGAIPNSTCLSNRFPIREQNVSTDIDTESVRIHSTSAACRLTIKKEKASTLEEFKLWLQDNPLEIIYPLATPIEHKIHIPMKNESNQTITKPNDVFTLPTLYTEQTHIDLTNNGIIPKVQSRDYIAYPIIPMIGRTYALQHNLTGGISNLTVDLLGKKQEITYQEPKSLIYSPETMDAILHNELRISGKGKISGVMYIDGGYMDRDIPYIEGMKNAVNPIVKNIGKNLVQRIDNIWYFYDNVINYGGTSHNCGIAPVKPYTQYIINKDSILCFYDENGKCTNSPFQYFYANRPRTAPSGSKYMLVRHKDKGEDDATYLDGLQVVEYGQEFDNQEYKENICYVDCGEIRLTPDMFEQGSINNSGDSYESDKNTAKNRIRTKELIKLEPSVQYVILGDDSMYKYSAHFFDKDGMQVKGGTGSYDLSWKANKPFTAPSNAPMAAFFIAYQDNRNFTVDDADFNFQLVKVSEIKQLRSLPNGVHDEIDLETGEYVQRVGEIVFNGDTKFDDWVERGENGLTFNYYDPQVKQLENEKVSVFADTLLGTNLTTTWGGTPYTVAQADNGNYLQICLNKNDLRENTRDGINDYFLQNPVTVQYELATPIVKDIVIHNYPHSYEGGHVIIENGDPNTPIPAQLTYRVVTNRSGQIQQHTEQVEKQEREINELETLILANIHLSQTR